MQILSQEILLQAVEFQPLASILSIYQDFSLNLLWIAFHNKPSDMITGGTKNEP
jgi:hypothetical protein